MRFAPIVLSIALASVLAEETRAQAAQQWKLATTPLVEIGVIEGDPNYELHKAISSVRLPDGRIVVLNAGAHQLRFFDASGKFLSSVGRKGAGPGEFTSPARVYLTGNDSLLVFDRSGNRELHFRTDGNFVRVATSAAAGAGVLFPRDVWLYGRNFIDGPPIAAERSRIVTALDGLPPPQPTEFRYIRVDPWFRLWVREPTTGRKATQHWSIYTPDGRLHATLDTPTNLDIHQFGPDFLLGRERTEMETEVIRLYALAKPAPETNRSYFTPAVARPYTTPAFKPGEISAEVLALLRGYLRQIATNQEIYYARNSTYAKDVSALGLETDRAVTPHTLHADDQGWLIVAVHRDSNTICAMGMGATPPGWPAGRTVCG